MCVFWYVAGLLFVGNEGMHGVRTQDYVAELTGLDDHWKFVTDGANENILKVVMVGTTCKPAIKAFPALMALARSFAQSEKKITEFARLLVEDRNEVQPELKELRILEVPTFLFYRGGKETGRLVSSNRGDLIGTILQQLSDAGISPPPPPRNATAGAAQRREARTARPKRNPWK
uniref:Thioredoxin domain-containing protein n=1 Tax=Dunaliella tertiolecta TaxID=3047 RepID=A0A7S3QLU0_DUNTE